MACVLRPEACRLRLAACGLGPASCGLRPAACGVGLTSCGLGLAACGLGLASCGLPPVAWACGLWPGACVLRPGACGLRPGACVLWLAAWCLQAPLPDGRGSDGPALGVRLGSWLAARGGRLFLFPVPSRTVTMVAWAGPGRPQGPARAGRRDGRRESGMSPFFSPGRWINGMLY